MKRKSPLLVAFLTALGVTGACDDPAGVEAPPAVASLEISAAPSRLLPGDSVVLHAVLRDAGGAILAGRVVTWASTDTTVVAVSPSGVVCARQPGSARVAASAEGKATGVDMTVDPHPVVQITVSPSPVPLTVDAGVQLHAVLHAASGAILEGRAVTWATGDPWVATVSPSGYLRGTGPGSTLVSATAEGVTGEVRVTVVEPPPIDTARFVIVSPNPAAVLVGGGLLITADVRGATGGQVPGARIDRWRSQDTTIATVSSTGVARGVSPGTVRIYARSGSVEGYTTLEVRPVPMPTGSYRLYRDNPGGVQLPVDTVDWQDPQGGTVQAHAYLKDAVLTLDLARGRYRQDFSANLASAVGGVYLGGMTWSQEGQVAYVWGDGSLTLMPDGGTAPAFSARPQPGGVLRVEQSVRGGAVVAYSYVPSQP